MVRTVIFQNYIAEGIRAVSENSARGNGKYISKPFEDVIKDAFRPVDTRTAEDIIENLREKLKSFGEED